MLKQKGLVDKTEHEAFYCFIYEISKKDGE